MNDDAALLHRYAAEGSQDAFAELVRRHLSLVYHAALRQTGGDPHRAEDVAQRVFTDLARKASALSHRALLVAWLHTATRHAAAELRRTELRRQAREQAAFAMNETELAPEGAADWERLRPLIDDALQTLGERDRAAVLLRFFENRSYAELAATLSVTEDAARVRVNRALEKLRANLARRGLVSTSAALALALAQPALAATPAGLAASVTTVSLSAAGTGAVVGATTGIFAAVSTAKIATLTAGAALATFSLGVVVYQPNTGPDRASTSTTPAPALSAAELNTLLHPSRLAPADADAALAAYLALPPLAADSLETETAARAKLLRDLIVTLPPTSFQRLLAATASRRGTPEARLRRLAFTAWLELDAPAAAHWIASQAPGPGIDDKARRNLASDAALAWAASSFASAYEWAASLSDLRDPLLRALLASLASTAPERALALARDRGDAFFLSVRREIFTAWSKNDPASAVRALGAAIVEPGPNGDNWELTTALAKWGCADPAGSLDWLLAQTHLSPEDNQELLRRLVSRAGNAGSPALLADTLRTHRGIINPVEPLGSLLNSWAETDPTAALAWLDKLPDAQERAGLLDRSLGMWSSVRPEANLALALHLDPGPGRAHEVRKVLERWHDEYPEAALAWLRAQTDPDLTPLLAPLESRALADVARADPAAAVSRWASLPAGPARTSTASAIASAWGERDPAAAALWWLKQQSPSFDPARLAEPFARDQTLTLLLANWGRRDPDALLQWAEDQKASAPNLGVHAIRALYQDFVDDDIDAPDAPATAARLARIADRYPNLMLLENHLRGWSYHDPAGARAWLDAKESIPPEQAARILVHMNPVQP